MQWQSKLGGGKAVAARWRQDAKGGYDLSSKAVDDGHGEKGKSTQ